MKKMLCAIFSLLVCTLFATPIFAGAIYTPPFSEVIIPPNGTIEVSYDFDFDMQVLNCYDTWEVVESNLHWKHRDEKYSDKLPITLKDDRHAQGRWADSQGTLFISNLSNKLNMMVNCQYQPINLSDNA